MPVSLNPALPPFTTQRTDAPQGVNALKANQAVKAVADEAPSASPTSELQLKGLDQLDSLAWLQVTDAGLASAQGKLVEAETQLPEDREAANLVLNEFSELTQQAHFQGQPVFATESPALEALTHLSDNPPYFMTSAGEAVDLFRQQLAEQLEAELQQESQGIPLGETLAEDLRGQLAEVIDQAPKAAGQAVTAEFSAQGLDFKLEGQTALSAEEVVFLDRESLVTTVVNGTELALHGPFIRLVGPVSDEEFTLPESEAKAQPQVAVDLQQKIDQLAQPSQRDAMNSDELQVAIQEAISLFDDVRGHLNQSLQALAGSEDTNSLIAFEAVQEAQQKAVEVFQQEPRAALQTQANATPDLVLNTLVE